MSLGWIEYGANDRAIKLDVHYVYLTGRGFGVRASGPVKTKAIKALNEAPKVTMTLIAPDGSRAFSKVIEADFSKAVTYKANHVTIYQEIAVQ